MLEPPNADGPLATFTEPRQFILPEKIQFLKSHALEKQFFHGKLIITSKMGSWFGRTALKVHWFCG